MSQATQEKDSPKKEQESQKEGGQEKNREEQKEKNPWKQEGNDLLRGAASGIIFGIPLLYTMEMWWLGMTMDESHLLIVLCASLVLNFFLNFYSGFREEHSVPEAISEAFTSVGLGIIISTIILWLIGELNWESARAETLGKILLEAVAVSVGVSFANSQLFGKSRSKKESGGQGQEKGEGQEESPEKLQWKADIRDIAATVGGAVVLAFTIAPIEEVLMIATRLSPLQQLILLGAELVICYMILFASGFAEHKVYMKDSLIQNPYAETVMACAVSLTVAFCLLYFMGFHDTMAHYSTAVATTITLGLPAVVGGAAGRIML